MPAAISLARLVSALQFAEPGAAVRIDTVTGEVVEPVEPVPSRPGSESPAELSGRYQTVALDVDDRELARRFCESISESDDRRRLETALSSAQPVESFENALYRLGIAHQWFPFRELQLGSLAKAWLEAQGLPFVDDLG